MDEPQISRRSMPSWIKTLVALPGVASEEGEAWVVIVVVVVIENF